MNHRYIGVDPALNSYVRSVLVIHKEINPQDPKLPLFAKGMSALMYDSENHRYPLSLHGQFLHEANWPERNPGWIMLYFFKPFAMGTVFSLSARSLREPVRLCQWNPKKTEALNLRLVQASSAEERVQILNDFIVDQIRINGRQCEIIRYATDRLMQNPDAEALARVIGELNLTERTFQRLFKKYVGVSPNEYRRICQFYIAFSQLKDGRVDKFSDLAGDHGYFDQSHYIRSFKAYTGTTPKGYLLSGLGKEE